MDPLVSLATYALLVALLLTGVVLGMTISYLYHRARRAEQGSTTPLTPRERAELDQHDAEIASIRECLDDIYQRQQVGSETQHHVVQQQIEQLQEQMRARGRQIEGLKGQHRHEMQQRAEAMTELRAQLREIADVSRQSLSLAASAPVSDPPDLRIDPLPAPNPASSHTDPMGKWSWEPVELDFGSNPEEDGARQSSTSEAVPVLEEPVDNDFFDEGPEEQADESDFTSPFNRLADSSGEVCALAPAEELSPADTCSTNKDAFEGLVQWTHIELDAEEDPLGEEVLSAGDGMVAAHESRPEARPAGADDLTVLPTVDGSRQSVLYSLGVHTIEEIARWTRGDARRIAAAIEGVTENDIMNEWVFAAQSVLFNRYQSEFSARGANA